MIEKTIEISLLIDFYNQLLTEKQREMIDLYYNQDFSLGEIGEEFNISRQAVYDTIKRTEKILYQYEEKLALIKLFQRKTKNIEKVLDMIISIEAKIKTDEETRLQIDEIKQLLMEMLK